VFVGHGDWVQSVTFSPDGAHIASGSNDMTVRMWDSHTGEQLAMLEGHMNGVISLSFSPSGKRITSKDHYGTELVWNVQSAWPLH
jgi:WD40 repeat protein